MKDEQKVKKYFEDGAENFDDIYNWMSGNQKGPLKRTVNQLFRKGMMERYILTLKECTPNITILDVGCGSGRISLALAERGLIVTGIDYSSEMINLANIYLKNFEDKFNTKLKVKFSYGDFMENFSSKELFDITLAIGVFDYIKNPIPFLEKMKNLARKEIIASYPAKNTFQMPIRKLWLWSKKCPVYFYTEKKIAAIYKSIQIKNFKIKKIAAGYFVKGYISK